MLRTMRRDAQKALKAGKDRVRKGSGAAATLGDREVSWSSGSSARSRFATIPGQQCVARAGVAGIIRAMARRVVAWFLVTPVAAAGILAGHALAYRLTGTGAGSVHAYLAHAPQVAAILATVGLLGLAVQQRSPGRRSLGAFALVAPLGFACQEHVERLVHTGELPWLLTTPAFLVGLVVQVPIALACVALARRVAGALPRDGRRRPALIGEAWLPLTARPATRPRVVRAVRASGRSPPIPLPS